MIQENSRTLQRILKDGLFYVYQRKYDLEREPLFTRFQKWYHKHVWLKFARFSKRVIGVPTGDGVDKNGDIFWIEHEGWCLERWQAEQVICRYESAGYHPLPVIDMLPGETLPELGNHVIQTNGHRHQDKPRMPCSELLRLADKIKSTDGLVEHFKSSS